MTENYQKAKRYANKCEKVMDESKRNLIEILPIVLKEAAATLPKGTTKPLLTMYNPCFPKDQLIDYILLNDTKYVQRQVRTIGQDESEVTSSEKVSYQGFVNEIGLENILSVVKKL